MVSRKMLIKVFIFLAILAFICTGVLADTNDYYPWTWGTSTTSLEIQDFTTSYSSLTSSKAYDWNNIANNIHISSWNWRVDMTDLGKDIRFYQAELPATVYGTTAVKNLFLGIYWGVSIFSYTGSIERAIITLDTKSVNGFPSKPQITQKGIILHEMGHSLGLAHPDCGSQAIMQTGFSYPWTTAIVTHDKNNLIAKWD